MQSCHIDDINNTIIWLNLLYSMCCGVIRIQDI